MNTVPMKVNLPTSRYIMGNGNKKVETPAYYEQELNGVELSSDLPTGLMMIAGVTACVSTFVYTEGRCCPTSA